MTPKSKKLITTSLRITVCVVALAWVLQGVTLRDYVELSDGQVLRLIDESEMTVTVERDGRQVEIRRTEIALDDDGTPKITYGLYTAVRQSNLGILLACLAVFAPVTPIQSLRFQWLLRSQEIYISYWESVKLNFAGNFLNFVAVGTTGGDVVKAYYLTLHTEYKTEAVTTVFLDRVAGLAGLLALVSVVTAAWAREPQLRWVGPVCLALLAALVVGCILLLSEGLRGWLASRRLSGRLAAMADDSTDVEGGRLRKFAGWVLHHARRADRATQRLLRHKRLVMAALAATVVLQFIAITAFIMVGWALGLDFAGKPVWDYYAVIASACIVGAIPISPQGLGTMEAVYKHFLVGSHGSLSQVLCMAMGIRILQLVWALPGFLVTMTGAYTPSKRQPETEAQVAAPSRAS